MKSMLYTAYKVYNLVAGAALAIGAVSLVAVFALTPTGPVVSGGEVSIASAKIPYMGKLQYTLDVERFESCPGNVIYTFAHRPAGDSPPNIVMMRRPVVIGRIGIQKDTPISIPLPDTVFPGKWLFTSAVDSVCPRHTRIDTLTTFYIEVVKAQTQDMSLGG